MEIGVKDGDLTKMLRVVPNLLVIHKADVTKYPITFADHKASFSFHSIVIDNY